MVLSLFRLQALAFRRAPYLGGRVALAAVKGIGVAYAVASAAILGVVLPDLLGVVAAGLDAVALVERSVLPALAALAVGRQAFQGVPTRGATAFLTLPVSRRRIASGVLVRSLSSPFNVVPLVFAVPFAARAVRAAEGVGGAWAFGLAVLAVVVVSHALLVVWKTRLGAEPVRTVGLVLVVVVALAASDWATGGLLAHVSQGGTVELAALGVMALATLAIAYRALVAALYLDADGARRSRVGSTLGFARGGARAFVDLDRALIMRMTFPRGVAANAAVVSVVLTAGALVFADGPAVDLVLLFSTGPVAGSFGQYAVPFASGFYDRLLTLPGGLDAFVRAKAAGLAAGTLALGAVQLALVLALAPGSAWLVGVSVLFSLGVLAPGALWGSTLGPKPIDVADRLLFTYTQSFGAQALVAATAVVAGAALTVAGPAHGGAVAAGLGVLGIALAPVWLRAVAARLHRQRHAHAARFRSAL
ncbi:DUF5687 family protein [Rubrivirga sp. IMCC43871]|uniref:DUF5687 family protein n=1 Tax=Rubrivirga sp. IMCC43871 TaxID=3391575 RepID=UPI00398FA62A